VRKQHVLLCAGPFPLALGNDRASRFLLNLNSLLIKVSPSLCGHQVVVRAKALSTVKSRWSLQVRPQIVQSLLEEPVSR
jgi:hypothetical protein